MNTRQLLVRILPAVFIALATAGVVFLTSFSLPEVAAAPCRDGDEINIPNLQGVGQSRAIHRIEELGLQVNIEQAHHASYRKGAVISQEPASGTIACGSEIKLTISLGPEPLEAPTRPTIPTDTVKPTDTPTSAAKRQPTTAAPTHTPIPTPTPNYAATATEAGRIQTATSIANETATAAAATQTAQAQTVEVPNVVGKGSNDAQNTIAQKGLVASIVLDGTAACSKYTVVDQNPAEGTPATSGSIVTIYVCPGIVVPYVIDEDKSTAISKLSNVGLNVATVEDCDGDDAKLGKVWTTVPGPGSEVDPGSTVTIRYYVGCSNTPSTNPGTEGPQRN